MTDLETTIQALDLAMDDELKARATYRAVIERFGPVRPFINIEASEERHIQALTRQYERLGLSVPADPWAGRVEAPEDLTEACRAGVQAELENVELYERLFAMTEDPQVLYVFGRLLAASQERHLRAFIRCAQGDEGQRGSPSGQGCRKDRGGT